MDMNRRNALQTIGWAGIAAAASGCRSASRSQPDLRYEVHGSGPYLISAATLEGEVRTRFVEGLLEQYSVVVIEPPSNASVDLTDVFTPDRACAEILSVADAIGADRFAYYGYSWGGTLGLQLADRTDRLTALVCGGWPPLGAPYPGMAIYTEANAVREGTASASIWATYYRSIENWSERDAVSAFTCPRMAFAGSDDIIEADGITGPIGPLIASHRDELEEMGWTVALVDGFDHELGRRPEVVVPMIREFLDDRA
jgi:pimeloyl-ACP methyl ester carboxylesterase